MKKILLVILAVLLLFSVSGCKVTTPAEIELKFDSETAYFSSSNKLSPIRGLLPQEGEATETAKIVISSNSDVKMQLTMERTGDVEIDGIMVQINGATPQKFDDNLILYTSATVETTADVYITIFLHKDTGGSEAGKTMSFSFSLSYLES